MRATVLLYAASLAAQPGVPVNRYDASVTGANPRETILTPAKVQPATFGKLYSYYVDGAVYAQPLYVSGSPRNVLYVATMNDKVYAFDADRAGPPLWRRDLTDELHGVTPVPVTDITNNAELNIVGNVGILGTPVIDRRDDSMFLVARTRERGEYVQRLHKLSLADGSDRLPPAVIRASDGTVAFDPRAGNQRTALAMANGRVIITWASHEDIRPYHGWVMSYDAATLKQVAARCITPEGTEGGIWQSGRPPAVDSSGTIYLETGNGSWDGKRNFGTSLLKLTPDLKLNAFFTPKDWEELNRRDADLGSTGPLLTNDHGLVVAGSKAGLLYVLDREKLNLLQTVDVAGGRILSGPVLWTGPSGPVLFLWAESDVLKAFALRDGQLSTEPIAKGVVQSRGSPGGSLTVSSDGAKSGTAIVWATLTNGNRSADHGNAPGILRAYNAETLQELWTSEQNRRRDRLGTLVKFNSPLVINGKAYVPNYDNAINVYGIVPQ